MAAPGYIAALHAHRAFGHGQLVSLVADARVMLRCERLRVAGASPAQRVMIVHYRECLRRGESVL
jgi:hypothetical protein